MSDVKDYFADRVDEYARFRPSYPPAAIRSVLEGLGDAVCVADVGAGTGISTRLFAEAGADVVGVEPNVAMRTSAIAEGPEGVRYVAGSADDTGLDDRSVDVVTCAQSFHWFDGEAALAEFHRILRPGGRLALIWNVRDDGRGLGVVYSDVVRRAKEIAIAGGKVVRSARAGDPARSRWFDGLRKLSFPNDQALTWEELIGRLASASYYPTDESVRAALVDRLREGFAENETDGRAVLPQTTEVTVCDRAEV